MADGSTKNKGSKRPLTPAQRAALDAGRGRKKGSPNKLTADLKAMISGALEDAGGQAYLARQAKENPTAFLTLVGKLLPHTLSGGDDPVKVVTEIVLRGVSPE